MPSLTNLLPSDRARSLQGEYRLRLVTVIAVSIAVLVLIHGVLLVPSYMYAAGEVATRAKHLAELSALAAAGDERPLSEREAEVAAEATSLSSLLSSAGAADVVRDLLALPHAGVRVTGVSVSPALAGAPSTMTVTGVANTRESLKRYRDALADLPFVDKADLPLSVYAAEADLPFTISLSGNLTP